MRREPRLSTPDFGKHPVDDEHSSMATMYLSNPLPYLVTTDHRRLYQHG
jgi:hypothetical protein